MSAGNEARKLIQFQYAPTKTTQKCPLEYGVGATFHMYSWALVNRKGCFITIFEFVHTCCPKPTVRKVGMQ